MKSYVSNFLRALGFSPKATARDEANGVPYRSADEVYECPASARAARTGDQVYLNGHPVFYRTAAGITVII